MVAQPTAPVITVYGDFNCPWSYLSWRRSELLAIDGVEVDWRAVEHEPWHHLRPDQAGERYRKAHEELGRVVGHLLPGESLPHAFNGHVPFTGAATAAYAEATVAGAAAAARKALFEAFWLDATDLNDGRAVRSLLAGAVRGRPSRSELISHWGYTVDVTGGPITTDGWKLVRAWRAEWQRLGSPVVPALVLESGERLFGEEAVDRLGSELTSRGLDVTGHGAAGSVAPAAGAA